jgi:hypothetical protein
VGLANGNLAVLELNSTIGKFYVRQMINTNHVGGIAKVFGKKARIYSVGGTDSILQVWWLNTTTQVWSLNQTLNDVGKATNRATAMHVSRNEKRIGIGRSDGDIIILGHPDENYFWSINKTITRAHSASVNFIRFTRNGWHFLSGAGDGVVRLWTKNDDWTVPANTTLNGQSVDWDDLNKQYTVGLYGFNNGKFTTQYLNATNCANGYDSSDKTRCTCATGLTWFNGGCNTLTCVAAPFKNINGFNSTTGSTSCACDAGYLWDETTLICIRDCSTAATPNSKGTNYEFLSCECNTNYQWDYATSACLPYQNCTTMANSPGTNVDSNSCNCNANYRWDTATLQCVTTKTNHTVAIACGIAIPLGVLALVGLGILIWWLSKRPPPSSPTPIPLP